MPPRTHSRLSPSATSRWINCPGSLALSEGIPNKESVYAAEGTRAHDIAERALIDGVKACVLAEDDEVAAAVQVYLDEIEFVRATSEVIAEHTERRLDCQYIEGLGGTADHVMLYIEDDRIVLHVFDYKHGVGVQVDIEENQQVLSYFVILDSQYPGMIDEFRGTIAQPRAALGGGVQTWSCGPERVAEHAKRIVTETAKDHLAAGDWCRWCPALTICPEVQRHALEIAKTEFSEVDTEMLLHFEAITPAVNAFLKKVPGALLDKFRFSGGIPGKKVVERLSHRRWKLDGDALQAKLGRLGLERDAYLEERLRTPPQVEKHLDKEGRKAIAELVDRAVVGYKIVPESARGEPVDFSVSEFEEFTE